MDVFEKMILGKSFQEATRIPTTDESIHKIEQILLANESPRILGHSETEGEVLLFENERLHALIVGASGEGKSKLLERYIRDDIDRGYGCCLLDPSDNGDTALKVLKYCAKIGFEKVVLIDPHDIAFENKVPILNPLHIVKHKDTKVPNLFAAPAIVGNLADAMRVLWGTKFEDTPRITKYLPAVLTALYAADMTLAELGHFIDRTNWLTNYKLQRILNSLDHSHPHRRNLESAFRNVKEWDGFLPTVNQFLHFLDPAIEVMVGSRKKGIDFAKLITQGYVILVNLDSEGIWGQGVTPQQRLLGTLILNEIITAITKIRYRNIRLGKKPWTGPYYLYIDEAADYTTSKIIAMLNKKRKSGLRLNLAILGFDGFSQDYAGGLMRCGTKILFNAQRDDRDKMLKQMYGGQLSDRETSYALSSLAKQECAIKINKRQPVWMKVKDTPDADVHPNILKAFKAKIYNSPLYQTPKAAREEINNRFDKTSTKTGSRNAPRPDDAVSQDRPDTNPATSGVHSGADNQTPTIESAPVDSSGNNRVRRTPVKRQKGISPNLLPQHPRGDEQV